MGAIFFVSFNVDNFSYKWLFISLPFYLGRIEPKSRNQKSNGKESLDHKKLLELLHEMKVLKQVVQELNYTKQKLEYNTENTAQVLNSKAIACENGDAKGEYDSFELCEDIVENVTA